MALVISGKRDSENSGAGIRFCGPSLHWALSLRGGNDSSEGLVRFSFAGTGVEQSPRDLFHGRRASFRQLIRLIP